MGTNDHDPRSFALKLPGVDDNTAFDLAPAVRQAFNQGWLPDRLHATLTAGVDPAAVRNVTAAYMRRLARLGAPPPDPAAPRRAPQWNCPDCNGSGWAEHPDTGLPVGKCPCLQQAA